MIVAASRMRHPLEARTLARLAAQHAGDGPGEVVGFGLSNDERRGETVGVRAGLRDRPAGRAAARAARAASCWARSVAETLDAHRRPTGSGTGCGRWRTRGCSSGSSSEGVALEVCPASNVSLGVYDARRRRPAARAGRRRRRVALGADDPLLFGSRLADQYATARDVHGFSDDELGRPGARRRWRPAARRTTCGAAAERRHRRVAGRRDADGGGADRDAAAGGAAAGAGRSQGRRMRSGARLQQGLRRLLDARHQREQLSKLLPDSEHVALLAVASNFQTCALRASIQ